MAQEKLLRQLFAIEFIADDELVEITSKTIRIRKRFLLEQERKRASRAAA